MAEANKDKVMVAIDESECSHYALEWALDNLKETISDSELVIFTVQPISDVAYVQASVLGTAPTNLVATIQEKQRQLANALLEKAKEICASQGIVAETGTEFGDPKVAICDAVEKLNVKLLVLGSHGKGAIKRAFLGSVSNYCVHNCKCPVLVVKKTVLGQ